jgi:hypothetical protein
MTNTAPTSNMKRTRSPAKSMHSDSKCSFTGSSHLVAQETSLDVMTSSQKGHNQINPEQKDTTMETVSATYDSHTEKEKMDFEAHDDLYCDMDCRWCR